MKILIVCSGNAKNFKFEIDQAFVYEQIEKIKEKYNICYETFFIRGKGILGYLKNLKDLKLKIETFSPDIIHSHFGLSGLLSGLQRKVPVIITFHGSDINYSYNRLFSNLSSILADYNIFVSDTLKKKLCFTRNYDVIPCGINLDVFFPISLFEAREKLKFDFKKIYILFASNFKNKVKNYTLAKQALKMLKYEIELIELVNKSREKVTLLLNASNLLLLTSLSEGSPQIIKEAMACNCPIVATNVGDIKEIINDTNGCFITTFEPFDVANKIDLAIKYSLEKGRTNGRSKILKFDNDFIAEKIYEIYKKVLKNEISNN